MAISVADNFSYQGSKPLDGRVTYSSVANMKAASEATLYNGLMAYVTATKEYYTYDSSNTSDPTTGRWRAFEAGASLPTGGTMGQVLAKKTSADGDVEWKTDETVSPYTTNPLMNGNATAGTTNQYSRGDHVHPKDTSKADAATAYATDDTAFTAINDADYIPVYDTSDTAKKKTLWSNIKSVLKTYFDTLYNMYTLPTASASTLGGVKIGQNLEIDDGVLNGVIPVIGTFSKECMYSTTEKVVGCWTDGRPIYQKTIDCGNLPNATSKNVAHSISNLNVVTGIRGYVHNSSNNQSSPIDAIADDSWSIAVSADRTNVIVKTWANYSTLTNFKVYATIQYTKTTDAANSFKYADENDYSTTEHIVGTWIDGKPVYQKTIDCGTGPNNTIKSVNHNISNISKVIRIHSIVYLGGNAYQEMDGALVQANDTGKMGIWVEGSQIKIQSNLDATGLSIYSTIQYTKTTD